VKQSKEVLETGLLAPRSSGFDNLNICSQHEITSVLGAIALRVAQILLPQDSIDGNGHLLKAMMESKPFERFVMPNVNADENNAYEQFSSNPAVLSIKDAVVNLGKSDYHMKVKLLSLLVMYPKSYVAKLIPGVGVSALKDAELAEKSASEGIDFVVSDSITRNCRFGPKENFLME